MNTTTKTTIVLFGLTLLSACASYTPLTEKQEYFIGRSVSANLLTTHKLVQTDPEWTEYLTMLGLNLAQSSDRPSTYGGYQIALVEHEDVNAFATPGGFIFVTTGAVKSMQTEDELAGVLAHEIAHVALKHPEAAANEANQNRQATKTIFAIAGAVSAQKNKGGADMQALMGISEAVVDDIVLDLIDKGYSRDQEFEADKLGTDLAARMGYDPAALKNFLQRLDQDPNFKKDSAHLLGWMGSTHPQPADRVQRLNAQLAKQPAAVPVAHRKKKFQDMKKRLK